MDNDNNSDRAYPCFRDRVPGSSGVSCYLEYDGEQRGVFECYCECFVRDESRVGGCRYDSDNFCHRIFFDGFYFEGFWLI